MPFAKLPKVELHLHLDCSLSYEAVVELRPDISLERYREDFVAPPKCRDLADFLTRPPRFTALMQDAKGLTVATHDLFHQLRKDQVIYAEIRFAPLLHTDDGMTPEEVVRVVDRETSRASAETGIEARLILCTLRHFDERQGLATAQLAEQFKNSMVTALDLAADEAGFPIDAHVAAFEWARRHGLECTAHAGEALGPESVWETLEKLKPKRIGHGVRSIEDPTLVKLLKERDIHLEICPSCNVQIDVFDTMADHPIKRLYDQGISVGINTDGRTISDIDLTGEYERLAETFGWGNNEFLRCNLNALHAAFLPQNDKQWLERRMLEAYCEIGVESK